MVYDGNEGVARNWRCAVQTGSGLTLAVSPRGCGLFGASDLAHWLKLQLAMLGGESTLHWEGEFSITVPGPSDSM